MRDIKFRAWDNIEKKRIDQPYVLHVYGETCLIQENGHFGYVGSSVELQQFTGLYDKNSKEIYEGDIVTWRVNGHEWTHEVGFEMGHFNFVNSNGDWFDPFRGEFEIIGNIMENPELLK